MELLSWAALWLYSVWSYLGADIILFNLFHDLEQSAKKSEDVLWGLELYQSFKHSLCSTAKQMCFSG